MFGKRPVTPPSAPDVVPIAARSAPRNTNQALKPVPVTQPKRVRRPRGGLLSMLSGLLSFGVVIAGTVVFGLIALEHEVGKPGPLAEDKVVNIPRSIGTSEISALLSQEGVINSQPLFELYSYISRRKGQLKAGEFLFKAQTSIEDAIDTLINGKAILHSFTVPEGLTSEQIVGRIRENDILTGNLNDIPREGSLMPDTYKFERGMTRQQFVNSMQAASRDALGKTWARRNPDLPIKTPQELVILASIVEKETGRSDERPRVASVFINRLQRRMKLQSDPTIVYGIVGGKGTLGRGITRAEIDRATPYNTYVIEGLPPGPIANPGRAALEAVANPLKTKDLFFVADGTGGHAFAETYDQHQRNVVRWRQLERSRETTGASPVDVDRATPPETRSDFEAYNPIQTASVSHEPRSPAPTRGFDATEGTARDPLLSRGWDLTTPKTVPNLGFEPEPTPRAEAAGRPAQPASRSASRKSPRATGPKAAEAGLPPNYPPRPE